MFSLSTIPYILHSFSIPLPLLSLTSSFICCHLMYSSPCNPSNTYRVINTSSLFSLLCHITFLFTNPIMSMLSFLSSPSFAFITLVHCWQHPLPLLHQYPTQPRYIMPLLSTTDLDVEWRQRVEEMAKVLRRRLLGGHDGLRRVDCQRDAVWEGVGKVGEKVQCYYMGGRLG